MRARRALLYTPGDDLHKIRKAITLGVDCICLDMEDGVALNRKIEARRVIAEALGRVDFGRSERLARLNPFGSGLETEDLGAVLPTHPDGIVIPKVESAEPILWADAEITAAERQFGWIEGGTALLVGIETALAVLNLKEIASASPRLQGLIFGSEDLASDLGAVRTPAAWEVFYARSAVILHAAACQLQAIDMVNVDFHDLESLRQEALQGAGMGYTGKQVIHPNQIEPVQGAFTPSDDAIAHARRVVTAFEEHQAHGAGAFALDGKMVDMPIVKLALGVLARARAAGKFTD